MDLDPEPLPNLVLHPGDALAVAPDPHDATAGVVHLYDRHGHRFAVLDCDRAGSDRFAVVAIRLVAAGGRELLPVRSEPDAAPDADPHLEPLPGAAPDGAGHTHRHAHHGTHGDVLANGLVVERYDHTHRHGHPKSRDDRAYHDDHQH